MKGTNPFTPWDPETRDFIGRKPEMELYGSLLKGVGALTPELLLVSGAPGSGRSALLRRFSADAEKAGFFAPVVQCGRGERFSSFMTKMSSELVSYASGRAAEGGMPERSLSALKASAGSEETLLSFSRMAGRHAYGMVLHIDNADSLKDTESFSSFMIAMMKAAIGERMRAAFVVSVTEGFEGFRGMGREVRLPPFEEHDIREMVETALKKMPIKMGEECLNSVINESEGNPYVAKTICWVIYDRIPEKEKMITQRHYLTYYPAIMSTLAREFFDKLYLELPPSEREVLRAFASAGRPAYISDIARAIGKRHATTLTLRLVQRGQLVRVDRGLYKVFTKLYGRYALQRG